MNGAPAKPSRNGDGGAYEWEFIENKPTGEIHMSFKKALAEEVVLEWVRSGLDSCEQIAKEMHVSNGTVSKLATKLITAGKLIKKGRRYQLADEDIE